MVYYNCSLHWIRCIDDFTGEFTGQMNFDYEDDANKNDSLGGLIFGLVHPPTPQHTRSKCRHYYNMP